MDGVQEQVGLLSLEVGDGGIGGGTLVSRALLDVDHGEVLDEASESRPKPCCG